MNIKAVDKMKITKFFNNHAIDDIYYDDFKEILGKNNYSDKDLLIYFISCIEENFKKEKFQIKLMQKYLVSIYTFVEIIAEDKINFEISNINRIRNFKDSYEKYLSKTSEEENVEIKEEIEELEKLVAEQFLKDIDNEKIEELIKVEEKEELQSQLEEQKEIINKLKTKNDVNIQNNVESQQKIKNLQKSVREKNSKIKELEDLIEKYKGELEVLKKYKIELTTTKEQNKKLEQEIEELNHKYNQLLIIKDRLINQLTEEYEEIQKLYTELKNEQDTISRKIEIQDNIENIILKYLCKGKYTIEELKYSLKQKGINISIKELNEIINKIRIHYNIVNSSFTFGGIKYGLEPPTFITNTEFTIEIPSATKSLDLIFTSDYHIDFFRDDFIADYEKLIEYCDLNKVKLIINLGDFFDFGVNGYECSINRLREMERIVENAIQNLTKASGIYQGVLGGNHDEWNAYLGKDFLKYFIDNREDFMFLGYRNASLNFRYENSTIAKFLLSHPHNPLGRRKIEEKLVSISNDMHSTQEDYYFTLLGHSHESYLDITNRLCTVPSFSMDSFQNGAWHIKLYFDNDTIERMHLKPLILEKKLKPIGEIVYKK